jgi:hypothetical protein
MILVLHSNKKLFLYPQKLERFVVMVISVVELGLVMALQAIHQAPLLKAIKIE